MNPSKTSEQKKFKAINIFLMKNLYIYWYLSELFWVYISSLDASGSCNLHQLMPISTKKYPYRIVKLLHCSNVVIHLYIFRHYKLASPLLYHRTKVNPLKSNLLTSFSVSSLAFSNLLSSFWSVSLVVSKSFNFFKSACTAYKTKKRKGIRCNCLEQNQFL